jgi:hypothetical protein
MKWLTKHLSYHRELYVFLPLFALLCFLAILAVNLLTGRAVTDDPTAVVGFIYNALGLVVAVILTGLTQKHLIGFRSENTPNGAAPLRDDVFDLCTTLALLFFFAHYLWH